MGPAHRPPRRAFPLLSRGSAGASAASLCPQGWSPSKQKPVSLMGTVTSPQCWQCVCVCPHQWGRAFLTCTGMCTASHLRCMCLPSDTLEHTDFAGLSGVWDFPLTIGCEEYFPAWDLSFQIPSFFSHFGVGKSQPLPHRLLARGVTLSTVISTLRWLVHTLTKGLLSYIWSLIHLGFPFQIAKMLFHIRTNTSMWADTSSANSKLHLEETPWIHTEQTRKQTRGCQGRRRGREYCWCSFLLFFKHVFIYYFETVEARGLVRNMMRE